jgi:peptidoglycan lytic transglycosylase
VSFNFARGSFLAAGLAAALLLVQPAIPRATPDPGPDPNADPRPSARLDVPPGLLPVLSPTVHPPVARDAADLWLAPTNAERLAARSDPALANLQAGLKFYADRKYDLAVARFASAATPKSPLAGYAAYYAGVSELRLQRFDAARRRFAELKDTQGYLSQAVALGEAEVAQGLKDYKTESDIYEALLAGKPVDEPAIWLDLAAASLGGGNRARAAEAYLHLYYEFPTDDLAEQAAGPLSSMPEVQPIDTGNARYKLELGRGERLFGLRRIADARTSFLRLKPFARGSDDELIALRLAECDYFQGRYSQARDAVKPYEDKGARQAEARFFHLMSEHGLKNNDSFEALTRGLLKDFPGTTWAEDALNNLVTYYIQDRTDEEIDAIVREQIALFPKGRYTERAAWKTGWHAYRTGNMKEAAAFFETGAGWFPRSDYRPAYLYWAGRAHEAMGNRDTAIARFRLETADYLNTYHGQLALKDLAKLGATPAKTNLVFVRDPAPPGPGAGPPGNVPPTTRTIRALLASDLYDPALKELEFAVRNWGDSPAQQATIAWIDRQKAPSEKGTQQFNLARGAINLMKRAYPQYLAAGGEQLPRDLLTVIYPLSYWDLIRKYSAQNDLDPYLFAALTSQESTFVADIRSSANAYGLTQLLPVTARQYARKLNMKYSSSLLTDPDANIKMGAAYFADTIRQFGAVHLALASYNAGPSAVRRWLAERPGLPRDEFIDDIPYPETQNYVKKILATADDYRRLYGPPDNPRPLDP